MRSINPSNNGTFEPKNAKSLFSSNERANVSLDKILLIDFFSSLSIGKFSGYNSIFNTSLSIEFLLLVNFSSSFSAFFSSSFSSLFFFSLFSSFFFSVLFNPIIFSSILISKFSISSFDFLIIYFVFAHFDNLSLFPYFHFDSNPYNFIF